MENKIHFQDLIARCSEFLNGVISQEELAEATKNLAVRHYIGIEEKIEIIQDILYNSYYTMFPIENKIKGLEIAKILKGFLAYFTNLTYDEKDKEEINNNDVYIYEVINLVLFVGSPKLVELFEKDYNKLCDMLDATVMQGDVNNLLNLLEGLDTEVLEKENKKLRKAIKDVTKTEEGQKAVADLLEIARFNDPVAKKMVEAEALKAAKAKTKKNK